MDQGYESFWTRPKMREEDTPLTMWHLLLPFIFLAGALMLSTTTFCIEMYGMKVGHKLWVWVILMMAMGAEIVGAIVRGVILMKNKLYEKILEKFFEMDF